MNDSDDSPFQLEDSDGALEKLLRKNWEAAPEFNTKILIDQKLRDGSVNILGVPSLCDYPDEGQGGLIVRFNMRAGWGMEPGEMEQGERERQIAKSEGVFKNNASAALATIKRFFSDAALPCDYSQSDVPAGDSVATSKCYAFEVPKEEFHRLVRCLGSLERQLSGEGLAR